MDARYLQHSSSRPSYPGSTFRSSYLSTNHMTGTDRGSTSLDGDDVSQIPQESNSSYHDYPTRRPLLHDQSAPGKSPRIIKAVPETRSRAIMSALRGLQERIRSLELERAQAESNLKSLATETTQYRDILQRQNTARDATQTEMSKQSQEVHSKLTNAESRCGLLEKQLEYMRKMVQSAEQDRQTVLHKQDLRESREKEVNHLERQGELKKLEDLEREHVRLKANQTLAEGKIRQLEDKVREERHQRKMFQDRAAELHTAAETNRILLDTDRHVTAEKPKKTKRKKRKTTSAPVKRSTSATGGTRSRHRSPSPSRHYRLNLGQIPFVAGTSTSPSHSVGANFQNVLAMMKTHHPAWCGNGPVTRPAPSTGRARHSNSVSSSTGSDSDLSDLLLGLQDEFGQMGFEHHELAKQIQDTDDTKMRDDLERELDELVMRMEAKGEQIARLKRHKIQVAKKKNSKKSGTKSKTSKKRPASARSSESNSTAAEVQVITTVKSRGKKAPPIRVSNIKDGGSHDSYRMLQDMRRLQTSLRKDNVSWD